MSTDRRWPVTASGRKCVIIGEVAQAHDGSLGTAHAFIDAIADAGADAVKFQTHIARAESTSAEQWRTKFSPQDSTRFDYWKRMEFSEEHWSGLRQHASDRHLFFLSSPFSSEAVELLERLEIDAWKIASGEVNNSILLNQIAKSRRPVLISTGMSTMEEIDRAVDLMKLHGVSFTVLQCTSIYPCPAESVGVHMLQVFRERYECPVGLSDHSGTIYPSLVATSLEADVVEVHVTLSREMFGPDVPSSVTTGELRQIVEGVSFIEKMVRRKQSKNDMAHSLENMRELFTKSLVAAVDLPRGVTLESHHLEAKKPGTGFPVSRMGEIVGRRIRRAVQANEFITLDDLE